MILCRCGCGGEIIIKRHHKWYGIPEYIRGHYIKGDYHPMKGKHHSEKTKDIISNSRKGIIVWNSGVKNPYGSPENHPNWKGGKKITAIRSENKRRRNLGFNPINKQINDDEVAHHLTKEFVVFVPEYINKSIAHNIYTGKNMDEVNFYTLNYLFLVYGR